MVVLQCNGVYKNLLTKILSGYFFAETRTSGGYPTLVYSILLNIATKLELQKDTHAAKLELLEATLVTLESYKRCCTAAVAAIIIDICVRTLLSMFMFRVSLGLGSRDSHSAS